jgi:hypothetical protein
VTCALLEPIRLHLEIAEAARAFHSASCHLDNADPTVVKAFAALTTAIAALDAFENPPAQECVQELVPPELRAELVATLRSAMAKCTLKFGCAACDADRARLVELGETP